MGRRRNKLGNDACLTGFFFLDMNTEFLKLRVICSRTRSDNQFLYAEVQSILVLPSSHFCLVPPHFVYSGDGTET